VQRAEGDLCVSAACPWLIRRRAGLERRLKRLKRGLYPRTEEKEMTEKKPSV